jgi:hypothetical protein
MAGEAADPRARLAAPAGEPPAPWRAVEPAGACAFGMATAGNRATGIDSAGIATVLAGGLRIARTDAVNMLMYGSVITISPATPNQNRCRRVPRPRRPPTPAVPRACAPAYAGVKPLGIYSLVKRNRQTVSLLLGFAPQASSSLI